MRPASPVSEIHKPLTGRHGAWLVHRFDELGSTNDELRHRASAGAPHGTVVVARHQTAGRGRGGRSWVAPPGQALMLSALVRDVEDWVRLPLVAAVAVAGTVGPAAAIKWPNDVVFATPEAANGGDAASATAVTRGAAAAPGIALRKVCGILCEGRPQEGWGVIGIGLNVALDLAAAPDEIAARAATMGGTEHDIDGVLAELLDRLTAALALPFDELLAQWSARDALFGAPVSWETAGNGLRAGTAEGVDERGRLRVRSATGSLARLDAGEVHLRSSRDGTLQDHGGSPW